MNHTQAFYCVPNAFGNTTNICQSGMAQQMLSRRPYYWQIPPQILIPAQQMPSHRSYYCQIPPHNHYLQIPAQQMLSNTPYYLQMTQPNNNSTTLISNRINGVNPINLTPTSLLQSRLSNNNSVTLIPNRLNGLNSIDLTGLVLEPTTPAATPTTPTTPATQQHITSTSLDIENNPTYYHENLKDCQLPDGTKKFMITHKDFKLGQNDYINPCGAVPIKNKLYSIEFFITANQKHKLFKRRDDTWY